MFCEGKLKLRFFIDSKAEDFRVLFVSLLKPKGKGEEAVKYLKELKAPRGVTVRGLYFTFGQYDGVIIFEAPDVKAAMNFVMQAGFATQYTMETLTAVSATEI